MTAYVDELQDWGWKMYGRKVDSCHLIADTPEELHAFASRLGCQRRHAQTSRMGNLHYDLTRSRRAQALLLGAKQLDRRDYVNKLRELRGDEPLSEPSASQPSPRSSR